MRIPFSVAKHVSRSVFCNFRWSSIVIILPLLSFVFVPSSVIAQTPVLTQHNNNARTGAYTTETILLYVPSVAIPGKGTHNVLFVASEHDSVHAFDADSNGGINATPLWHITLLDAAHGAASARLTLVPEIGITGTPVIDPATVTLYIVGKTKEGTSSSPIYVQRLHALDITTGAGKFGGPVTLVASVPGTGNGTSGGVLNFDPKWQMNRAGLLLQNGVLYLAFGSHGDNGPWHGWLLSHNAATLKQVSAYCTTPNGSGSGIWMDLLPHFRCEHHYCQGYRRGIRLHQQFGGVRYLHH
jgi:hypothetical protein